MIRPATREDRFALVRMARDFHAASGLRLPFDPAYAERSALRLMQTGCVLVLSDLRGVIAGHMSDHPCWPIRVASDVIWWVDPEARGRGLSLLRGFERWATLSGADVIAVRALGGGAGPILERAGYALAETAYYRSV